MRIAVVGSGVVGLTTALELQKEYRTAQISIIADKFYKETTSYVAAGIFRPGEIAMQALKLFVTQSTSQQELHSVARPKR